MYKIQSDDIIIRLSDNAAIPKAQGNKDYNQFLADVKEYGTGIVKGADVIEPDYIALRTGPEGYVPTSEQLDILTKQGVKALQAVNNTVKEKYPKTITGGVSIAPLPDWILNESNSTMETLIQ
ncbi:MAG: hypothetical protein GY710_07870 [Desulfobacteraceae bacterium]|nr:hypothetical protein [Desulfobacteraceae bacterium]